MLDQLFLNFLAASWGMSAVVLLLLCLEPVTARNSTAVWRQWIWFAVILGFLLPIDPIGNGVQKNESNASLPVGILTGRPLFFGVINAENFRVSLQKCQPKNSSAPGVEERANRSNPDSAILSCGPICISAGSSDPFQISDVIPYVSKKIRSETAVLLKRPNSKENIDPSETVPNFLSIRSFFVFRLPIENLAKSTQSVFLRTLLKAIPYCWLAGVLFIFLIQTVRCRHFSQAVKRWSKPVDDPVLLDLYKSIRSELCIKKEIPLIRSTLFGVPFLFGFFHPTILLPETDLAEKDLRLILRHELTHYRSGHLWIRFFGFLAATIHWFNPFAFWAARSLVRESELACDEKTVPASDSENRYFYSLTILAIAQKNNRQDAPFSTGSTRGSAAGMKRRFRLILEPSAGGGGPLFFLLTAAVVIIAKILFRIG